MKRYAGLTDDVVQDAFKKGIDLDVTLSLLDNCNTGKYDSIAPIEVSGLPELDGKAIVSLSGSFSWTMKASDARVNLESTGWKGELRSFGEIKAGMVTFDTAGLYRLGLTLLPAVSYGILNGGSATSFFDQKKNSAFDPALFELYYGEFNSSAEAHRTSAKGLTPAFYNRDGSPGPSFIELKMRNALIRQLQRGNRQEILKPLYPLFQMTSVYNNREIQSAYTGYRKSPILKELIEAAGTDVTDVLTGVQPLLGAFTHSSAGKPRRLFTQSEGKEGSTLPLPGGHGQNFYVLKEIYKKLLAMGKRFIYLGNVDNLGYTPDPPGVALLAVSGREAGFDFSFKTPVDIKGGILVYDQRGKLNCADIGPAISEKEVARSEASGKTILFNCASGLFNLKYLTENIDTIIEMLPMRITDQEKDVGYYAQAEQITWEIISMLDNFFVFAVDKYQRFLAAKLALETFMTSGLKLDHPGFPEGRKELAGKMFQGLRHRLQSEYGMEEVSGRWMPIPSERILSGLGVKKK